MEYKHIILERRTDVARVIFNRPDKLNAFNEPMLEEIESALNDIVRDNDIRIVVFLGSGRAFSAGVDLKTTQADGFGAQGSFMQLGDKVGKMILNLPKVTIAQVHGYCFTGALELMMFFDICYCTHDTQFGDTHAKWGIMPRWGMSQRLARRIGLHRAKEMTFRAMRIKGVEAERIGLVNRSYPSDELTHAVQQICDEILENSHDTIVRIKRLYDGGYRTTLAEGLQLEYDAESTILDTQDLLNQFSDRKFNT